MAFLVSSLNYRMKSFAAVYCRWCEMVCAVLEQVIHMEVGVEVEQGLTSHQTL